MAHERTVETTAPPQVVWEIWSGFEPIPSGLAKAAKDAAGR